MSFPRYPNYKASGVEWLGDVPEHWEIAQLRHFVDIENGTDHKHVEQSEGFPVYGSGGVFAYASDFLYNGESVLLGRKGTIDKPLYVNGPFWTVDTMYWTRIRPNTSGRYAYYAATTFPFDLYSTNTALPSMTKGVLNGHVMARPPLAEQTAIAEFLDQETAKIDGLVAEQRRLMALLKEKRQAVISHAVAKGLNPHAPMKPSGIEWLGDVPEHWETAPLKRYIAKVESGTSVNSSEEPADEGKLGVLKTSCVYRGYFEPGENKTVVITDENRVSCPLKAGSLIVSRMNTTELIGAAGLVTYAPANLFLPDRLWQISFCYIDSRFIYYWTQTRFYRAQAESQCTGTSSSMKNLGQAQFGSFNIAMPPKDEQMAISQFLENELAKFDALTAEAQCAIDLLQERRTALISAAVTGQIDVRQQTKN